MTQPPYRRTPQGSGTEFSDLPKVIAFLVAVVFVLNAVGVINIHSILHGTAAKADTSTSAVSGKVGTNGSSADAAKILAEALKLDDESYVYGGGHSPRTFSNGDGVDCSGAIDVAVYRATGIDNGMGVRDFLHDSHWSSISFSQLQPGDVVYILKAKHPEMIDDHMAIVVTNKGGTKLRIFEAATSHGPQANQVRQRDSTDDEWDGALRFRR